MRETLLESALSLFEEQGYAATTVEDIAERADVAPRTFFRYFPDKAAILRPTSTGHVETFIAQLDASPPEQPLIEAAHHALRATLQECTDDRERVLMKHRIAVAAGIASAAEDFADVWATFEAHVARRLGTTPDTDPRPALLTGITVAAAESSVRRWLNEGATSDLGEFVDDAFAVLGTLVDPVPHDSQNP